MPTRPTVVPDDEAWFPRWLGPSFLAVVFAALVRWSWRKWPDALVDFGSQLYIPWQLSEGRALYVDIDYKDGPLSQYLNAFWFSLFGVSFDTIVWCNLVLLGVLCVLVYTSFARVFGRFTATLAVFVQLMVFSFGQYTQISNYNYVTPYAHEQTHGLLLAVAMLAALGEHARSGRARWATIAGVALGLASLTKAEISLPALMAAVFGLVLAAVMHRPDAAGGGRVAFGFVGGIAAPIALAVVLLATRMPWTSAWRGAAGNWVHLRSDILGYSFYRAAMGLDDPTGNATLMLTAFAIVAVTVALAIGAAFATRRLDGWPRRVLAIVAGGAVCGALIALVAYPGWSLVSRSLPITAALGLVAFAGRAIAHRHEPEAVRWVAAAIWAAFAFGLLGKIVLDVRLTHYGFVLALPATLVLIATLTHLVPGVLDARGANGTMARALLVAPIIAGAVFYLHWANKFYVLRTVAVGQGHDAFLVAESQYDPRGPDLNTAADHLSALMPPGATLMAIPDGLMLNYWLRSPNPTRHIYFVPWSLAFANGEAAVLAEIEQHPPDFIAVVDRSANEYGFDYFGDPGFGDKIMAWVKENYRRVDRIGNEPFRGGGFGVVIGSRRSLPGTAPGADAR